MYIHDDWSMASIVLNEFHTFTYINVRMSVKET